MNMCVCIDVVRRYPSVHLLNIQKRSWPQMVKCDAWLGEGWSVQVQLWCKSGATIPPPSLCPCGHLHGHWSRPGSCVFRILVQMVVRVERNLITRENNYRLTTHRYLGAKFKSKREVGSWWIGLLNGCREIMTVEWGQKLEMRVCEGQDTNTREFRSKERM